MEPFPAISIRVPRSVGIQHCYTLLKDAIVTSSLVSYQLWLVNNNLLLYFLPVRALFWNKSLLIKISKKQAHSLPPQETSSCQFTSFSYQLLVYLNFSTDNRAMTTPYSLAIKQQKCTHLFSFVFSVKILVLS